MYEIMHKQTYCIILKSFLSISIALELIYILKRIIMTELPVWFFFLAVGIECIKAYLCYYSFDCY